MKLLKVFLIFMVLRLCSVFVVQTFFVPDEYWQSVEIAHRIAFGYGYQTWEWTQGIRSFLYPAILSCVYSILKLFNLDSLSAIIYGPRLLQAIITALADYTFWKWYCALNSSSGHWAMVVLSTSWFWMYCGSRTLINTFEAALTTIALSIFPWNPKRENFTFLWFVAIVCFVRPTAMIVWFPLCLHHIFTTEKKLIQILSAYFGIGLVVGLANTLLDSYFYGRWIFTPYNFLKANVINDISQFYGSHSFFWYLYIGVPAVLGTHLIPFALQVYKIGTKSGIQVYKIGTKSGTQVEKLLLYVILWSLIVFSIIPHKEFRFLLPLLPMFFYIATSWLVTWSRRAYEKTIWIVAALLLVLNAIPIGFLGIVHQRGTLDVMHILKDSPNALFLMPCHSTPLYSHIHANTTLRFLTCEPDFTGDPTYLDEAEIFYQDPAHWLKNNYSANATLPSDVVIYDVLYNKVEGFLSKNKFKLSAKVFHTYFPDDRIGEYVKVYTRQSLDL